MNNYNKMLPKNSNHIHNSISSSTGKGKEYVNKAEKKVRNIEGVRE